ncbi:BMP family ABC transporter substrate-binding protein [Labrys neptuniae]
MTKTPSVSGPFRYSASRRQFLIGTAGVAAFGLLSSQARAAEGLVALVHTQAAGDNGPVDGMIASLKKLAGEKGFATRIIYAQDAATYESIFRSLGDAGASVVVSTFNEVAEPFKAVAPEYPNTKFVQLYADPFEPAIPNVVTVAYDYYLGCYLSGLFGSRISKTGAIGYIGGASIPGQIADLNALKAAAAVIGPNIKFTGAFAGSFQDPAKGHEIANQLFQSGVDYIQTDSAATDTGIIQAATEAPGRLVSAISREQYKLGPKAVAAIVKLDFGLSLYQEVSKALTEGWKGHHVATGIDTGVIDFELSDTFLKEGPADLVAKAKEIWPDIEKAKKEIIAGTLKVPLNTAL